MPKFWYASFYKNYINITYLIKNIELSDYFWYNERRGKGVIVMIQTHCCENCQRPQSDIQIERYLLQGHVANLCLTCAYILVDEQKPERFLALCRRPVDQQTNRDMKKVHAMLSQFILVGVLFATIVAAMAVVQLTSKEQTTTFADEEEYLSFSALSKLNEYN